MLEDKAFERKSQVATSRVASKVNIFGSYIHELMNIVEQKLVDYKAVVRCLRKSVLRRHSVVD